jgi:ABC-type dipeptide/oligopeptide/nickel transport system permease subunit
LVQAGAFILLIFSVLALAAPALTRLHMLHEPIQQDLNGLDEEGMPRQAGGAYVLGTDNLGRDVLARVIYGARVSLTVGATAMLTATMLGVAVGLVSGFYGGKLDLLLMRFTEMNMTVPAILLAIAFAGFGNPTNFFLLGGMFLGAAMTRHGLDRRLALSVLTTNWSGRNPSTLLCSLGIATALVSMWISNTAATAMVCPVALGIIAELTAAGGEAGRDFPRSPHAAVSPHDSALQGRNQPSARRCRRAVR